jgi:hypothetical protein
MPQATMNSAMSVTSYDGMRAAGTISSDPNVITARPTTSARW